jgi:hypothetical protein
MCKELIYLQSNYGSVNATILLVLFGCYCHNMFRSYDHHQAAYIGIMSQAVCSTAIAVSWICNHELWLHIQLIYLRLISSNPWLCLVHHYDMKIDTISSKLLNFEDNTWIITLNIKNVYTKYVWKLIMVHCFVIFWVFKTFLLFKDMPQVEVISSYISIEMKPEYNIDFNHFD